MYYGIQDTSLLKIKYIYINVSKRLTVFTSKTSNFFTCENAYISIF